MGDWVADNGRTGSDVKVRLRGTRRKAFARGAVLACCFLALTLLPGGAARAQNPSAQDHYTTSLRLLSGGELGKAAEECSLAIKLAPNWAEAHLLLGRIDAAQKQPRQAQEMFEQAIKLKPDFAEAYLSLGLLHLQQREHEQAVAALRAAIRLKPDFALAHLSLGNALLAQGKLDGAVKEFQTTLDLDPQNPRLAFFANFGLGSIDLKRNDDPPALQHFQQARTLNPGDPEVLFSLCEVDFKMHRDSDALAMAQELAPAESRSAEISLRLGLLLVEYEKYADALPHLENAEQQGLSTFELYEARGAADYNLNRYADASQALSRAVELNAQFPQTYFILGKTYAALNDARAAGAYEQCVKLDPNRDDAWEALSQEMARRGDADQAVKVFGGYAQAFPQKPLAHLLLGEVYFNQAQYLKALGEFQKAAALAPRLGRAEYSIGLADNSMGKFAEAKQHLQRSLDLDPSLFLAAYHLGEILGDEGDYERSLRLLHQAVELDPQYPEAYVKLGEDYFHQKNYPQAEQSLKQAVQLQPENAQAHFLLSRVYIASNRPELGATELEAFRRLREKQAEKEKASGLAYKK